MPCAFIPKPNFRAARICVARAVIAGSLSRQMRTSKLSGLEGQDGLEVEGEDAVDERIAGQEIDALAVHEPGDEAPRVLPLRAREEGGRPQDVALGPALDDEDLRPRAERLEIGTVLADALEAAGLVPAEMDAVVSDEDRHGGVSALFMPHFPRQDNRRGLRAILCYNDAGITDRGGA